MLTKDLLHFYFGIHTPALCYQLRVFSALRFSRIPAAQALCADVDNPSKCGVISLHGRRSFEAARNDAALASVPFLPKHTYADCPLRRIAALLWYPRRVSSACFLAVRQLSFCIREEYDTCVE